MPRGGKRPGAGRPKQDIDTVSIGARVSAEAAKWLRDYAEANGKLVSDLIREGLHNIPGWKEINKPLT